MTYVLFKGPAIPLYVQSIVADSLHKQNHVISFKQQPS